MIKLPTEFEVEVLGVTDGDTLNVRAVFVLPFGMIVTLTHPMRLSGLNCPELTTAAGKLAKEFTTQWFTLNPAPYTVRIKGKGRDKYGRILGLLRAVNNKVLNEDLLAAQHAIAAKVAEL